MASLLFPVLPEKLGEGLFFYIQLVLLFTDGFKADTLINCEYIAQG
jgi:hypothetical protein